MIIDGHPDILRGPQGLNGLHGFGTLPPAGSSPAFIRFLPEKGGKGIPALYQEIRDFISTHNKAEIDQAMQASGVSNADVVAAFREIGTSPPRSYTNPAVGTSQPGSGTNPAVGTSQPESGTNLAFLAAVAAGYFILGA